MHLFMTFSAALGIARTSSALHSLARKLAAARHSPSKLGLCARLAQTLNCALSAYCKRWYMRRVHCAGCTNGAGCKPNCCTQPRAAPWGNDVALIKVSRSVRAACIMRGNAPCGVKGINGLRAFGAWHFCAGAKMPNVSIAVYVPPGRCPGLWATFGLTARPNHLPGLCANWLVY